ncbi:CLUMA_CG014066, isoform A [Clunio marinus]|uniref:CLUMA_CG014066, isoform A n=1 Tax=Clunio marinus TaxID=568069 RepID=A0A1J1IKQ2_9DIPT|nr:CLUMA_CG014066, isoform A [Clunio marinus]
MPIVMEVKMNSRVRDDNREKTVVKLSDFEEISKNWNKNLEELDEGRTIQLNKNLFPDVGIHKSHLTNHDFSDRISDPLELTTIFLYLSFPTALQRKDC